MPKAYYLDTDNICNFRIEYFKLFEDITRADMVFLMYTRGSNKSIALNTMEFRCNVNTDNIRVIECEPGKDSLDHKIIDKINEYLHRYSKHIIISNDKGYDSAFNEEDMERIERRGTIEIDKELGKIGGSKVSAEHSNSITDTAIRTYNSVKRNLDKLDDMVGKYVIIRMGKDEKVLYLQDKNMNDSRLWTLYLVGAECFDSPKDAYDSLQKNLHYSPMITYVTGYMVLNEKRGLYEWFYRTVSECIEGES